MGVDPASAEAHLRDASSLVSVMEWGMNLREETRNLVFLERSVACLEWS